MSEKYKFVDPEGLYFATTTVVGQIYSPDDKKRKLKPGNTKDSI